jgi:glycerol-3-phosphate dehydrogenase (NAD(P)+)
MTRHAAVIGAGAWGTALADVLAQVGGPVRLWAYEPEVAEAVETRHENTVYLPGHPVHAGVRASTDLAWVVENADVVVSVSPSQVVRGVMAKAASHLSADALVVSASKGIETGSFKLMHEVLDEVLPPAFRGKSAALSGPSFAAETAKHLPTAVSLGCADPVVAEALQKRFTCPYFRVYTVGDVTGVEVGGALKNVIALAAGISDGLGFGHNSRAALITRGIAEIGRLGVKMGADPLTFLGLSGLGDLVLTATGELSRNRTVGVRLGRGERLSDILASMKAVAEGVKTCEAAMGLSRRHGVEMPICEKVWEVLDGQKDAKAAVRELMGRPTRKEFWDLEGR